ncbi:SRA stem-loop-interacting RNA-binding protein, mitochondrial [Austrofundulus limnaeus]|uniref:SRA stem-loop-interacting RNA-binding protein, mitochondrial n=1 Tax=Austrofundulus limnaeus TaxID=52670 RepID=A0A2I4BHX8_AUSLI|nr:PREDICTED: SRA stem-loop-interacting RNA-binding protein, mitochondrial [Austrofundulus limnaeus]
MATAPARKFEVLVNRIPWTAAVKELRTYFGQFGKIKHCYLPFDRNTGFHKGHSWIVFSKESELQSALEKRSHILDGTKVKLLFGAQT